MSSKSKHPLPNIGTILVYKREHFETYKANFDETNLSAYQHYSIPEIADLISSFNELTCQASDMSSILEHSNSMSPRDKLHFTSELSRVCELGEYIIGDLDHILDQICMGKCPPKRFKKLEPNIVLLHSLVEKVIKRLNLLIDREMAYD